MISEIPGNYFIDFDTDFFLLFFSSYYCNLNLTNKWFSGKNFDISEENSLQKVRSKNGSISTNEPISGFRTFEQNLYDFRNSEAKEPTIPKSRTPQLLFSKFYFWPNFLVRVWKLNMSVTRRWQIRCEIYGGKYFFQYKLYWYETHSVIKFKPSKIRHWTSCLVIHSSLKSWKRIKISIEKYVSLLVFIKQNMLFEHLHGDSKCLRYIFKMFVR